MNLMTHFLDLEEVTSDQETRLTAAEENIQGTSLQAVIRFSNILLS